VQMLVMSGYPVDSTMIPYFHHELMALKIA